MLFYKAYGRFRKSLASFLKLGNGVIKDCVTKDANNQMLKEVVKQTASLHKVVSKCEAAAADQLPTLHNKLNVLPDDLVDGINFQVAESGRALIDLRRAACEDFNSYFESGTEKSWKCKLDADASFEQVKNVAHATISKINGQGVGKVIKQLDEARFLAPSGWLNAHSVIVYV